jgi:hypothetical protein
LRTRRSFTRGTPRGQHRLDGSPLVVGEFVSACQPASISDSGHRAMALYNKMIGRVERWLDQIDDGTVTTADIFKAYSRGAVPARA